MKAGMKPRARCAVAAIAACSWLVLFNHCAFAAAAPERDSKQVQCPFHSKPKKKSEQPRAMQCCKILRAIVLSNAKSWARDDAKFSKINFSIQQFAAPVFYRADAAPRLNTGPPRAASFAELILQRSILSHAPPPIVA
jgi:hypothetical protein